MLVIYGSMLCPDCIRCREALDAGQVEYRYLDFSGSLLHLKAFLKLRDTEKAFDEIRGTERIGIPCIVDEAGQISFSWEEFIE